MITTIGEVAVGVAVPGCTVAVTAGMGGINGALPDLQGRIEALISQLAILPTLPPFNPLDALTKAQQLVASLQAMIALGLPVPDLGTQIAALTATLAGLQVTLGLVNAQLAVLANLQAPLGVAGIGVYAYDGPAASFGGELAAAIGGSTDHCNALALVAFEPAAWAALSAVMKVSP
jgi:microcystin-dependent protein